MPTSPVSPTKKKEAKKLDLKKLEQDIAERILALQTPRPIIETLKKSDKHKQLLDNILLDQLKLNEEIAEEEEEDAREVIKNYKTLREGNDPGIFTLPIRIEGK